MVNAERLATDFSQFLIANNVIGRIIVADPEERGAKAPEKSAKK